MADGAAAPLPVDAVESLFHGCRARGREQERRYRRDLPLANGETMAFGDGQNDIEMLRHAGIGVVMGNAAEEVQAAADYVTASVDEDGVSRALRHFGLI